jgi:ribosomal-protein-alanine N-acetyltransferase
MSHFPSDVFPAISTERLHLRQIQPNDLQALYTLRTNTQVLEYVDRAPLENIDAAATLLQQIEERYSSREGIMWILTVKDNPQHMIGNCGFWRIEWENHRAEV